jgi:hypothetical protein
MIKLGHQLIVIAIYSIINNFAEHYFGKGQLADYLQSPKYERWIVKCAMEDYIPDCKSFSKKTKGEHKTPLTL